MVGRWCSAAPIIKPMSEASNIIAESIVERAPWTTDPVKNLTTGQTFTAEIDGSPDAILIATELGEDARNVILLHVTSDAEAALINKNDQVQFTLFGSLAICTILKRRDSAAQPQTDFWAMQKVPGKDT